MLNTSAITSITCSDIQVRFRDLYPSKVWVFRASEGDWPPWVKEDRAGHLEEIQEHARLRREYQQKFKLAYLVTCADEWNMEKIFCPPHEAAALVGSHYGGASSINH